MSDDEIKIHKLQEELAAAKAERDQLRADLTDRRLTSLETGHADHDKRIRVIEEIGTRFNTIYYLFAGNGLMSVIILFRLFTEKP